MGATKTMRELIEELQFKAGGLQLDNDILSDELKKTTDELRKEKERADTFYRLYEHEHEKVEQLRDRLAWLQEEYDDLDESYKNDLIKWGDWEDEKV